MSETGAFSEDQIETIWGAGLSTVVNATETIKFADKTISKKNKHNIKTYSFQNSLKGSLPDYELIKQLGVGGFGVVHLAKQNSVDRSIAIKMIKNEHAEKENTLNSFLLEACVTADLDHPNIVPIYDMGKNELGQLFYSMKQVKGDSWRKSILTKSVHENLYVFLRVCDAISFAHSRNIIHLDLKPENIILGEFGEVYVMDWGSAASVVKNSKAEYVKNLSYIASTPSYMAPEIARLELENINKQSDIYQLGAILFEILEKKPPHQGRNVREALYKAANSIFSENTVKNPLMDIALKAMSPSQSARYTSVKEMQAAIALYEEHSESLTLTEQGEKYLAMAKTENSYDFYNQSIFSFKQALDIWPDNSKAERMLNSVQLIYAGSAFERQDFDLALGILDKKNEGHQKLIGDINRARIKRDRKNRNYLLIKRSLVALLVVLFIIVSAAAFFIRKEQLKTQEALVIAREEKKRAATEAKRSSATLDFFTNMISKADPMRSFGNKITISQILDMFDEEINLHFSEDKYTKQILVFSVGRMSLGLGDYNKAKRNLEISRQLSEDIYSKNSKQYIDSSNYLGEAFFRLGYLEKAENIYSEVLALSQSVLGINNTTYADILNNYAELCLLYEMYDKSRKYYEESREIYKKLHGRNNVYYAARTNNLAEFFRHKGEYNKARLLYDEAITIYKKSVGEKHSMYAMTSHNLAELLREQGHLKEALPIYKRAIDVAGDSLGKKHPYYAVFLHNFAVLNYNMGNYSDAESLLNNSMEISSAVLGDEHPYVLASISNLGNIFFATGRYYKAKEYYSDVLEKQKNIFGKEHESYAINIHNLASVLFILGEYKEAELFFKESLQITEKIKGDKHYSYADSLLNLSELYLKGKKLKEAIQLCEQAMEIFKVVNGEESSSYAVALLKKAKCLREMKNLDKAYELAAKALSFFKKFLDNSHPYIASTLLTLSRVEGDRNNHTAALKYARQALEKFATVFSNKHPYYASALEVLAGLYEGQNNLQDALKVYQNVLNIRSDLFSEDHPEIQATIIKIDNINKKIS